MQCRVEKMTGHITLMLHFATINELEQLQISVILYYKIIKNVMLLFVLMELEWMGEAPGKATSSFPHKGDKRVVSGVLLVLYNKEGLLHPVKVLD